MSSQPVCGLPLTQAIAHSGSQTASWGEVRVNGQVLSLFRILFSGLLLVDFCYSIVPDWPFLFSEQGMLPSSAWTPEVLISFLTYSGHPLYQGIWLGLYVLAMLGLLCGVRARLCAFYVFLFLAALYERNPVTASNAERCMYILAFWVCFLPLDRYWSVDGALRNLSAADRAKPWPLLPFIALRVQIATIYLLAGLYKLGTPAWTQGDAIKRVMSDSMYGSATGLAVLGELPDWLHVGLCWGIIILQIAFVPLVYFPARSDRWRALALLAAASMHIGFICFMQIHLFPYLSLLCLLLLVPDRWLDCWRASARESLAGVRIYYDPDCGFCRSVSLLFREFCLTPGASVLPASTDERAAGLLRLHQSWVVEAPDGRIYLKWAAVNYLLRQSVVLWPVAWLCETRPLVRYADRLYDAIGRQRFRLSQTVGWLLRGGAERPPDSTAQLLCLVLIVAASLWSALCPPAVVWPFSGLSERITPKLTRFVEQTALGVKWDLFAPPYGDRWEMTFSGVGMQGEAVDVSAFTSRHYQAAAGFYTFATERLRNQYVAMFRPDKDGYRRFYADIVCRAMNQPGDVIKAVRMELHAQPARSREPVGQTIAVELPCRDLSADDFG